jgi:photosynthetic reaction center H subunit
MGQGALTSQIDVAQLALVTFALFFVGLVVYLLQENNREGYPLAREAGDGRRKFGRRGMPVPKVFVTRHDGLVTAPPFQNQPDIAAVATVAFSGGPLIPKGSPMLDGLGAAAFATRATVPDLDWQDGKPKIVPLRLLPNFHVAREDADPRGMPVLGADGVVAGTVRDLWIDRTEVCLRYLEVELAGSGKRVLAPMPLANVSGKRRTVSFRTLLARHFDDVPLTASQEAVTLREEDQISGFFAGGQLYATAARSEPLI